MTPRPLSIQEREVLDLLLSRAFDGRDALRVQARNARTNGLSCGCGCPSFSLVVDRELPPAETGVSPVAEAHGTDPGGNLVGALLSVTGGYLINVEVFGWAGSVFAGLPRASALQISEWSDPDDYGVRWLDRS